MTSIRAVGRKWAAGPRRGLCAGGLGSASRDPGADATQSLGVICVGSLLHAAGTDGRQGCRTLTCFQANDLREEIDIPAGHSPLHGDALFVRVLFQQRDCETFEPR